MNRFFILLLLSFLSLKSAYCEPSNATDYFESGIKNLNNQQYRKALKMFKKYYKTNKIDPLSNYAIGLIYLKMGNAVAAIRHIDKVLKISPQNAQALLLLAISYVKLENFDSAQDILKKINKKQLTKEELQLYQYYFGVCTYRLKKFDNALLYFKTNQFSDSILTKGASLYSDNIYRLKGIASGLWSLSFSLSSGFDSNVTLEPQNSPFTGTKSKKNAFFGSISTAFSLRPFYEHKNRAGIDLTLYRDFHSNNQANDFNLTYGDLKIYFNKTDFFDLKAGYDGSLAFLDGGELVEENSFYGFMESHGFFSNLTFKNPGFKLIPEVSIKNIYYHSLARNVTEYKAMIKLILLVKERLQIFIVPAFVYDHPISGTKAYEKLGTETLIGISFRLNNFFDANASFSYYRHNYFSSAGDFGIEQKRLDNILKFRIQVNILISTNLALSPFYSWFNSSSTVPGFTYPRHQAGLAFTWRIK